MNPRTIFGALGVALAASALGLVLPAFAADPAVSSTNASTTCSANSSAELQNALAEEASETATEKTAEEAAGGDQADKVIARSSVQCKTVVVNHICEVNQEANQKVVDKARAKLEDDQKSDAVLINAAKAKLANDQAALQTAIAADVDFGVAEDEPAAAEEDAAADAAVTAANAQVATDKQDLSNTQSAAATLEKNDQNAIDQSVKAQQSQNAIGCQFNFMSSKSSGGGSGAGGGAGAGSPMGGGLGSGDGVGAGSLAPTGVA